MMVKYMLNFIISSMVYRLDVIEFIRIVEFFIFLYYYKKGRSLKSVHAPSVRVMEMQEESGEFFTSLCSSLSH